MSKKEKTKKITKIPPAEISLPDLVTRINQREIQIDTTCKTALHHARNAVLLAIDQGNDLSLAKSKVKHGCWEDWIAENFSKSYRLAASYMQLAERAKLQRAAFLNDVKSIREAFRILGLLPEVESETRQLTSITVAPIISRLNFVAEWVTKSADEITSWEQIRRDELKLQLKPVVELFEKL